MHQGKKGTSQSNSAFMKSVHCARKLSQYYHLGLLLWVWGRSATLCNIKMKSLDFLNVFKEHLIPLMNLFISDGTDILQDIYANTRNDLGNILQYSLITAEPGS
ncbi:hypothetical protein TNCV_3013121 [Trichonephila clavipes]|nr:hypothetical protein TNCV_3013121 [Trichonephila clavipes]